MSQVNDINIVFEKSLAFRHEEGEISNFGGDRNLSDAWERCSEELDFQCYQKCSFRFFEIVITDKFFPYPV